MLACWREIRAYSVIYSRDCRTWCSFRRIWSLEKTDRAWITTQGTAFIVLRCVALEFSLYRRVGLKLFAMLEEVRLKYLGEVDAEKWEWNWWELKRRHCVTNGLNFEEATCGSSFDGWQPVSSTWLLRQQQLAARKLIAVPAFLLLSSKFTVSKKVTYYLTGYSFYFLIVCLLAKLFPPSTAFS